MPEDGTQNLKLVTCTAPVNIAVIKYWGKRDEDLVLPINSSLSVTLHQDQLKTTTTVASSRSLKEDRIWLNGKEENINLPRLQSCLREIRRLARKRRSSGDGGAESSGLAHKVHICSVNNFPTAAGLASSAAGYACLVYALARLYGLEAELSEVARLGSGSACRSVYGGFVQWLMGEREDGKDSVAEQVEAESHWPELRVLILVVSAERKLVGSTAGMQTSVETSPLLKHRADAVVPQRMREMIAAIRQRDFAAFGELTMKDSNQFHATCLDTCPPIFYLNDTSRRIISLVHRYNTHCGETRVAYTFDAGPNAVIYTLQQHLDQFVELLKHFFPPETNGEQFVKGLPVRPASLSEELKASIGMDPTPKGISYIISTKVGPGPCMVEDPSLHLLGSDGLPKKVPDQEVSV
ncbi:diphosphomevalonate decarboxylase isoform X2 [Lepisosteus oculatus]|uniref:diphosphomevalonate decarboxylase isoform X2 n=1 Tax=Lepisosteus oculatus TaxID=7918 RepID=UPI0035F50D04